MIERRLWTRRIDQLPELVICHSRAGEWHRRELRIEHERLDPSARRSLENVPVHGASEYDELHQVELGAEQGAREVEPVGDTNARELRCGFHASVGTRNGTDVRGDISAGSLAFEKSNA